MSVDEESLRAGGRRARRERAPRRLRSSAPLLARLLSAAVENDPAAEAIRFEGQSLTYAEVDERSSKLAWALTGRGIGPEDLIAVSIPRSIESVLAVWAIVKAGAGFVPIDPNYPIDRIAYMVGDSGVILGLTVTAEQLNLPRGVEWLAVDGDEWQGVQGGVSSTPTYADRVRPLRGKHPAYVIYTSGSTGRPKGVMVTQDGLANFAAEQTARFAVSADRRTLHFSSPSFDISIFEFLLSFTSGTTMVIAPPSIYGGQELADLLVAERVTHVVITPSALASVQPVDGVRVVIVGGEACPAELVTRWAPGREFHNGYGPTETTVVTNIVPLVADATVTIGGPIRGVSSLVLDPRLNPVPVGVAGELYTAGAGLARGYIGQPGLTATRFVANPFAEAGSRMYRTGDVVRWAAAGDIKYVGRSDFQVKVRGFRIELGEIDAVLSSYANVDFAVTLGRELQSGVTALVGYVKPLDGSTIDVSALDEHARAMVPQHMVPSAYVVIDRIPLTPTGKLDRDALPEPIFESAVYREPETPTEKLVASVFADVLRIALIGADDDFFDLGGNSLIASRVAARLGVALGTRVPLRLLFETSTVSGLAAALAEHMQDRRSVPALVGASRVSPVPLSHAQEHMWLLNQLDTASIAYNIPFGIRIWGAVDEAALRASIMDVIERHEPLRTIYPDGVNGPHQHILTMNAVTQVSTPKVISESEIHDEFLELASQGFDVSHSVPLRVGLFKISDQDYVLVLVLHHIAGDGGSVAPLVRDVTLAYTARAEGQTPEWAPLDVQYADYAIWQRSVLGSETDPESLAAEQARYWVEQLAGSPEVLNLPADRPRPSRPSGRGATAQFTVDHDVVHGLHDAARQSGASLFMVLHAALTILLGRVSNTDDVAIGTQVAGRGEELLDDLIGMFGNTVVLRSRLDYDESFDSLLTRIREGDLGALANSDIPIDRVVELLRPRRSHAYAPLFQVLLVMQNFEPTEVRLPDMTLSPLAFDIEYARLDLTVELIEQFDDRGEPSGMTGTLVYAVDLFDPSTMDQLAERFVKVLATVAADPLVSIGDIDILQPYDREILDRVNAHRDNSAAATLLDLFDAQVARTPDAPALMFEEQEWTYREFDLRANRLARHLISSGVGPESLVGLAMRRSMHLLLGIYAVLKAGGGYVPIDPDHPAGRTRYVLSSATPAAVLTTSDTDVHMPAECQAFEIDTLDLAGLSAEPVTDVDRSSRLRPENVAYVIYTSGSTGQPKGVAVSHEAVVNQMLWMRKQYDLDSSDAVLHKTPVTFDASVWELFLPLQVGARLIIARPEGHLDPEYLVRVCEKRGVSILEFVPSMLALFLTDPDLGLPTSLRYLSVGGEILPNALVERALDESSNVVLDNTYGPTEATITSTVFRCSEVPAGPVPIGSPVPNTQVYVLDARLRQVPLGVPGELYLAGKQVARGYQHRQDLTCQRFVANPFATDGSRMYRTGDLACVTKNGNLEFRGRTDFQVKLRGLRIELGEIEATLATDPAVARVVVVVQASEQTGDQLVAYVVGQPGTTLSKERLTASAAASLPAYMVPGHIVELDTFPLNASGKLDFRALPPVEVGTAHHWYRPPSTVAERSIAEIFTEMLGTDRVGVNDSFFELGGNSLIGMRTVSRINAALGCRIGVRELFDTPTVGGLAVLAETASVDNVKPLVPVPRPQQVPLSFAQQRMWFLNRFDTSSSVNNIAVAVRLSGSLDPAALQAAVADVVDRHEVLRTLYPDVDGVGYQCVVDTAGAVPDLAPSAIESSEVTYTVSELVSTGFDVSTEVPLRVRLFELSATEFVLVLVVHHISADGYSMGPLTRDVMTAYSARVAGRTPGWAPLQVQYADYALWQRNVLGSEDDPASVVSQQVAYWSAVLAGLPDELTLPSNRPRPLVSSYHGARHHFLLSSDLQRRLAALGQVHNASLFMVMHSALAILLARLSGTDDIAIGTPVAGRDEAAVDDLIGMFVNTLVLRTHIGSDEPFTAVLARARETDLQAFGHSNVPFERLVEVLNPPRSQGRHPLFQVLLAFQNHAQTNLELPGLSVSAMDFDAAVAKVDLQLTLTQAWVDGEQAGLSAEFSYATDLFDKATIVSFAEQFLRILEAVAATPDVVTGDIELMDIAERELVLTSWNATDHEVEQSATLVSLFEAQVARTPDAVAVSFEHRSLTYRQFAGQVHRLARWLISQGVGPESLVAVGMRRSVDLVVAMYAVMEAGAGYVPLDPDHPSERIGHIVDVSDPVCVLSTTSDNLVLSRRRRVVNTDVLHDELSAMPDTALLPEERTKPLSPGNIAYVIFTSGSTGRPKGVAVTHAAIVNQVCWMRAEYGIGSSDVYLQKTATTFDVSLWGYFVPLASGARLIVATPDGHRDLTYLSRVIVENAVTLTDFVPSMLSVFVSAVSAEALTTLRHVFVIGEALPAVTAAGFAQVFDAELHNIYGPTEAAVSVTNYKVDGSETSNIPIGVPEWNSRVYVLDDRLRPVAVGTAGELYLSGAQLARGYLTRPDLTTDRFVACPFDAPGTRMYRTGDVVRWSPSGVLEYLRRSDFQVKLRGQRIELGEIESAMVAHASVAQSVVTVHSDSNLGDRMVGYVTPADGLEIDAAKLKQFVAQRVPGYMLPEVIVALDRFPLNPSGKLDRAALPAPTFQSRVYRAPTTPHETAVADSIADVLGVERVGLDDNFFDLGGNSLIATQLVSRLSAASGIEIPVRWIFTYPNIEALAARITQGSINPEDYDRDNALQLLLPLRPGVEPNPLFCIHPMSGLAWCYAGLVPYIDRSMPVYGVQTPALLEDSSALVSIDALAERYVEEIKRVQPQGPYRLLGWSLGGVIAHAMAVELQKRGEVVTSLVLLDSVPNIDSSRFDAEFRAELRANGIDVADTEELTTVPTLARAQRLLGTVRGEEVGLTAHRLQRVLMNAIQTPALIAEHTPQRYHGDLAYISADIDTITSDPVSVWQPYVTGVIRCRGVAVSHGDMMSPDALAKLGPLLDLTR